MGATIRLAAIGAILALAFGCSGDGDPQDPVGSSPNSGDTGQTLSIPAGAAIESAALNIFVAMPSNQRVQMHRITEAWDEVMVTWNSFGNSYAGEVSGLFVAGGVGWHTADVTHLVEAWVESTLPNHGIILDQDSLQFPRTIYLSRESAQNGPFLEVCYADADSVACIVLTPDADVSVDEAEPNSNFGLEQVLFTGRLAPGQPNRKTLLRFDLPLEEPEVAAVGDFVWHDDNGDGLQDKGEGGVSGVAVRLYRCGDSLLATTVTDSGGLYLFDSLPPGDYYLEFVPPPDLEFCEAHAGADDTLDSDADPGTGATACFTLASGEFDVSWDAGLYRDQESRQEGCTRTIGYWKNHAGFGRQADEVTPLLPVWLGNAGGPASVELDDAQSAVGVLNQNVYGDRSNGITKLYAQLLATKLNVVSGASADTVADAITDADAFLASNDWTVWDSLDSTARSTVLDWKDLFDTYNNGLIGPGHCPDIDDEARTKFSL